MRGSDRLRNPETDRASHPLVYRLYRQFCRGIYGWAAPVYDSVADLVSGGQWENWLRLARDEVDEGRVLEIGFGTGRLQALLARRRDLEVHGLELSADMQSRCKKRMRREGLETHRVRGNGMCLPYGDQSFDMILATFPEEYIVHSETLGEFFRVLRPGGKVMLLGRWISLRSTWLGKCFPVFYRRPSDEECESLISEVRNCGLDAKMEHRILSKVVHHLVHMSKPNHTDSNSPVTPQSIRDGL